MAKLYFRYSAMEAGKTLDIIKVSFNYKDRGQNVIIFNSVIDKRAGNNKVKSRTGFECDAITISQQENLFDIIKEIINNELVACILIDEIHFFTVEQINQISDAVDFLNVPIICYGLRSDYCGNGFPSAERLMVIADSIEELKTICFCGRKATHNILLKNNEVVKSGEIYISDDDNLKSGNGKYISVCRLHWKQSKVSNS